MSNKTAMDQFYDGILAGGVILTMADKPSEKIALQDQLCQHFNGDHNPGGSPIHPDYIDAVIDFLQTLKRGWAEETH